MQVNTYQCVLTTDGNISFIILQYATNGIQWTAGDSHGINGKLAVYSVLIRILVDPLSSNFSGFKANQLYGQTYVHIFKYN